MGIIFNGSELYQIQKDGSVLSLQSLPVSALSPDRQYSLTNTNGDFWLTNRATSNLVRLTMTENRVECCATWWTNHPDKILFLSNALGGNPGIATNGYLTVIKQDGTGYLVLDPDHPSSGIPAVSPDGVWIAYGQGEVGWLFGGELGPQKVDPVDYGLVSLKGQSISYPAWSADGRFTAWKWQSDLNSGSKVGVLVLDMVNKTYQLAPLFSPDNVNLPLNIKWSPDGKYLAYSKSTTDKSTSGTYLISYDDKNLSEVQISNSKLVPAMWSKDSQKIALLGIQPPEDASFWLYQPTSKVLSRVGLDQYSALEIIAWDP